jgi:hypothetical protein
MKKLERITRNSLRIAEAVLIRSEELRGEADCNTKRLRFVAI